MKKELDKTKASFKFDLIETANADPMLSGSDFKLLAAYVAVMAWPSCRTWLATSLALAMTGLSERQFRESRKKLLGQNDERRAYLFPARQGGKISAYRLVNPWRDEARTFVAAKLAYHREVERQRKAGQRATVSLQNLPGQITNVSRQNLQGQNEGCPGKICRSVPAKSAAYTPLMITPREEGSVKDNPHGSNVVPFNKPRKAS